MVGPLSTIWSVGILVSMGGLFAVGFSVCPGEYISDMMCNVTPLFFICPAIAALCRIGYYINDFPSIVVWMGPYVVAWIACTVSAFDGGDIHDVLSGILIFYCDLESFCLYIQRLAPGLLLKLSIVVVMTIVPIIYAIAPGPLAEYGVFWLHVLADTAVTFLLPADDPFDSDSLRCEGNSQDEDECHCSSRTFHRLDITSAIPLVSMYVTSMVKYFQGAPQALEQWQVPQMHVLLAGDQSAGELMAWRCVAMMSVVLACGNLKYWHLVPPFMAIFEAVLRTSRQHISGSAGDYGYLLSCAGLVLLAGHMAAAGGRRFLGYHPNALVILFIGLWCSSLVLAETVSGQWITSLVQSVGEHVLALSLPLSLTLLPVQNTKSSASLTAGDSEMGEVVLA